IKRYKLKMKKNIFISGFSLDTSNRGTQALGYGALSFLKITENLTSDVEIISPSFYKNPIRYWSKRIRKQTVAINDHSYNIKYRMYWTFDVKLVLFLFKLFGTYIPLTSFGRDIKDMHYLAAICGGDGFSDIYSDDAMRNHLKWIFVAKKSKKPYIFLPQTIGPFNKKHNYELAEVVLKNAQKVNVRDSAFLSDLNDMEVTFQMCDDLSYYMEPAPVSIEIPSNAIGVNISGLCYYNTFHNMAGEFTHYKLLLTKIVEYFQSQEMLVYIIPHSYNYNKPNYSEDDLSATKEFYQSLSDQNNIILIDQDLKSPQIKYLISRMSFFVGSRMHSCFAAIYTNTPVFGLGYSYKYEHNFSR